MHLINKLIKIKIMEALEILTTCKLKLMTQLISGKLAPLLTTLWLIIINLIILSILESY